jgi:MoaA/NifB/PqqE/SkfB family radical SAM enzyme
MLHRLLYSPFLTQIVVTRRCNLSCGYCNEFSKTGDPVPTETLKERLRKIRKLGSWSVEWTGGEPLLHPDLVELTRYAKKDLKFTKVMLISNGFLMSPDRVNALNEAGLDHLQVSVDGVATNDITIKVLSALKLKLEHVIKHARFQVTINGVIGSAPAEEVLEVMNFARKNGLKPRVCLIHAGDGGLHLSPDDHALYQRLSHEMGRSFRESGNYRQKLLDHGRAPFKCRAGSRYLYIDEEGMVRWCSQQRETWGKALLDYTPQDLRAQFHTQKDCNTTCTVGCVRTCSKVDWFRPQGTPQSNRDPIP